MLAMLDECIFRKNGNFTILQFFSYLLKIDIRLTESDDNYHTECIHKRKVYFRINR